MKQNIISLLIIFVVASLFSCDKKEEKSASQNDTTASAEISSNKKIDLKISKVVNIGMLKIVEESITVTPDKNVTTSIKNRSACFVFCIGR